MCAHTYTDTHMVGQKGISLGPGRRVKTNGRDNRESRHGADCVTGPTYTQTGKGPWGGMVTRSYPRRTPPKHSTSPLGPDTSTHTSEDGPGSTGSLRVRT